MVALGCQLNLSKLSPYYLGVRKVITYLFHITITILVSYKYYQRVYYIN